MDKCYCCGQPAVEVVKDRWLCQSCFEVHKTSTARIGESIKGQVA